MRTGRGGHPVTASAGRVSGRSLAEPSLTYQEALLNLRSQLLHEWLPRFESAGDFFAGSLFDPPPEADKGILASIEQSQRYQARTFSSLRYIDPAQASWNPDNEPREAAWHRTAPHTARFDSRRFGTGAGA